MRQITQQASKAFWNRERFSLNNTLVSPTDSKDVFMYLHGNTIASIYWKVLEISHCGWKTKTTKERLNWILERIWARIFTKKGVWYIEKGGEIIEFDRVYTFTL